MKMTKDEMRFVLGKQLLKAGTSIGANIEEAQGGISKKDFIHSMNIAKKEARETKYWLRLYDACSNKKETKKLLSECNEIGKY